MVDRSVIPSCFVVVLGSDGAGKSTLLRELGQLRPEWTTAALDPSVLYEVPGVDHMSWTRTTHPRMVTEALPPLGRTTLLAHILSILHDFHIAPALRTGGVLVCDSYDYRFRAKERVVDPQTAPILETMSATLPRPDLVAWLDVPLEVAWRRKGGRCSFFEGGWAKDYAGFVDLQQRAERIILEEYLTDIDVVRLDGLLPVCDVAQRCLAEIERVRRRPRSAA